MYLLCVRMASLLCILPAKKNRVKVMELLVKYGASIQAITEVRALILHAVSDNNI